MDLDEATAELYAGDPDDFVGRRKALAAAVRAGGDAELARRVAAVRKPTRSAWLVDLVAQAEPDALGEFLDLGPALSAAHSSGSPAEVRRLSSERSRAVSALVGRAESLGLHRRYRATASVRDEVRAALEAALLEPELASRVRAGTLATVPELAASFPTQLFGVPLADARQSPAPGPYAAGAATARGTTTEGGVPRGDAPGPDGPAEARESANVREIAEAREHRERERQRQAAFVTARSAARDAHAALAAIRKDLSAARDTHRDAEALLERLRGQLASAERDRDEAAARVSDATRAESQADAAARATEDALARAREALERERGHG